MKQLTNIMWQAEEGKIFKSKTTEFIGSNLILLGINDNINNYEEVDEAIEESEQEI